jgi:hypothetical protein
MSIRIGIRILIISVISARVAKATSNHSVKARVSAANELMTTREHLEDEYYKRAHVLNLSASSITYPMWLEPSGRDLKLASVYTSKYNEPTSILLLRNFTSLELCRYLIMSLIILTSLGQNVFAVTDPAKVENADTSGLALLSQSSFALRDEYCANGDPLSRSCKRRM